MFQLSPMLLHFRKPGQKILLQDFSGRFRIETEFRIMKDTGILIQDGLGHQGFDLAGSPKLQKPAGRTLVKKCRDHHIRIKDYFHPLWRLRAQRTAWAIVSSLNPFSLNRLRASSRALEAT